MKFLVLILSFWAGLASAQDASVATGAALSGLDKIDGMQVDIDLLAGQTVEFGQLLVELRECRYPAGNPSGDAFAYLVIREEGTSEPLFSGWMIASAPALNPLDHSRYDIWVLRCTTS